MERVKKILILLLVVECIFKSLVGAQGSHFNTRTTDKKTDFDVVACKVTLQKRSVSGKTHMKSYNYLAALLF